MDTCCYPAFGSKLFTNCSRAFKSRARNQQYLALRGPRHRLSLRASAAGRIGPTGLGAIMRPQTSILYSFQQGRQRFDHFLPCVEPSDGRRDRRLAALRELRRHSDEREFPRDRIFADRMLHARDARAACRPRTTSSSCCGVPSISSIGYSASGARNSAKPWGPTSMCASQCASEPAMWTRGRSTLVFGMCSPLLRKRATPHHAATHAAARCRGPAGLPRLRR
jgi:hypothetical protein